MKDTFDIRVGPGGTVEGIYQDDLAEVLDAKIEKVERASHVEWETDAEAAVSGWTVRSAKDPEVAIRLNLDETEDGGEPALLVSSDPKHPVFFFKDRETALGEEVRLFWKIIERDTK